MSDAPEIDNTNDVQEQNPTTTEEIGATPVAEETPEATAAAGEESDPVAQAEGVEEAAAAANDDGAEGEGDAEGEEDGEQGAEVGAENAEVEPESQLEPLPQEQAEDEGLATTTEEGEGAVPQEAAAAAPTRTTASPPPPPAVVAEQPAPVAYQPAPSPTPAPFFADPSEGNILVRFTARPEGFYFQQHFPTKSPTLIMYKRLESQLFLSRKNIQLYWEGRPLGDADVAADICILPESDDVPLFLDLEIEQLPEHLQIMAPGDQVVKAIRTQVHYGDDVPQKQFFISIAKGYDRKPFIGGWRHKSKPLTYHNAATQCSVEAPPAADMSSKLCRTTQTAGVTRSCQTRRECGTQMPKPDLLVDDTYDRIRVARPYFSADRLIVLQTQKTVTLQAFVRGWRARKIARKMREERNAQDRALAAEDARRREEHQLRRQDEIQRRTHPTTAQDFNVLHNELEAWRLQEVERINAADISDAERRIAMQELLKKQTKLLQTIDRLQLQASKENRFRKIHTVLNKMASAKVWGTNSGTSTVNVETPFTVRARELRDLYDGLQLVGVGIDERLDILLHVKWTVKEFECPLTREIVELIDREADLLNRGRREASLSGLRQRLSNLFLQFVETPEFNPEAAQFQRVPLEYTSRPSVKLDKK